MITLYLTDIILAYPGTHCENALLCWAKKVLPHNWRFGSVLSSNTGEISKLLTKCLDKVIHNPRRKSIWSRIYIDGFNWRKVYIQFPSSSLPKNKPLDVHLQWVPKPLFRRHTLYLVSAMSATDGLASGKIWSSCFSLLTPMLSS